MTDNNAYDLKEMGRKVFEAAILEHYNPQTKQFRVHPDGHREEPYCTLKYLKEFSDCPGWLKDTEQYYLYEGL